MSRWNISIPGLLILSCIFFLMLLIVVLPDVDLPDAAFHNGNAPVVVHAHATSAPAAIQVATASSSAGAGHAQGLQYWIRLVPPGAHPNFRPILLRSIRC